MELSLNGGNVKHFPFSLKNSFFETIFEDFLSKKFKKFLRSGMHCYAVFTKRKNLKFDSMFVLLVLKVLFLYQIIIFLFYLSTSEHAITEKSRDKTVTKTKPNLTVNLKFFARSECLWKTKEKPG